MIKKLFAAILMITAFSLYSEKKVPYLLSEEFYVYTNHDVVVNQPYPGFTKVRLPTVNKFKGTPGCYIACYSNNKEKSIYSVGNGIYVMGQVRVAGKYEKRVCIPHGFDNRDISASGYFKKICAEHLASCSKSSCWAGGDTGGWFGIQEDGTLY